MQGAVVVEESESVIVGDQGGEDVEEGASDAVVDGDGESVESDDLEISFGSYIVVSVLTFSPFLEFIVVAAGDVVRAVVVEDSEDVVRSRTFSSSK